MKGENFDKRANPPCPLTLALIELFQFGSHVKRTETLASLLDKQLTWISTRMNTIGALVDSDTLQCIKCATSSFSDNGIPASNTALGKRAELHLLNPNPIVSKILIRLIQICRCKSLDEAFLIPKCTRYICDEMNVKIGPSLYACDRSHLALCLFLSCYYRHYKLIDAAVIPVFGVYCSGFPITMSDDIFFFCLCLVQSYNIRESNEYRLLFSLVNASQYTIFHCDPKCGTIPPAEIDRLEKYCIQSVPHPTQTGSPSSRNFLPMPMEWNSAKVAKTVRSIYQPAYGLFGRLKTSAIQSEAASQVNKPLTILTIYIRTSRLRKYLLFIPFFTANALELFFRRNLPKVQKCEPKKEPLSTWNHFIANMAKRQLDSLCFVN